MLLHQRKSRWFRILFYKGIKITDRLLFIARYYRTKQKSSLLTICPYFFLCFHLLYLCSVLPPAFLFSFRMLLPFPVKEIPSSFISWPSTSCQCCPPRFINVFSLTRLRFSVTVTNRLDNTFRKGFFLPGTTSITTAS